LSYSWETYEYDKSGRLIAAENQDSVLKFERNYAGQVIKEWQNGEWVENKYNELGSRVEVSSSLGAEIHAIRSNIGQSANMFAMQEGSIVWEAHWQYNGFGQITEQKLSGSVLSQLQYDVAGRAVQHNVSTNGRETRHRSYTWGTSDCLKKIRDELKHEDTTFSYDEFAHLNGSQERANAQYPAKMHRMTDEVGNLFRTEDKRDRIYGAGSRLEKSEVDTNELRHWRYGGEGKLKTMGTDYLYDAEGNLVNKTNHKSGKDWKYEYYGNGMLSKVILPGESEVSFKYDPLGRRIEKRTAEIMTRYIWDGNNPLHEAHSANTVTWIFNDGFIPTAKITDEGCYSIVSDYLGTPAEAYAANGERVWTAELNIYGGVTEYTGAVDFVPFRYQGQYHDVETGLYYNRFRYYDPELGQYIQQDPIGLAGGNPTLYAYVRNPNAWIDPFGLRLSDIWNTAKNALNEVGQAIGNAVGSAVEAGSNAVNYAIEAGSNAVSYVIDAGSNAVISAITAGSNAVNYVVTAGSNAWDGIQRAGSYAWDGVQRAGSYAWDGVQRAGSNAWDGVQRAGSYAVSNIRNAVGRVISR